MILDGAMKGGTSVRGKFRMDERIERGMIDGFDGV
jgi:hypothetical protein